MHAGSLTSVHLVREPRVLNDVNPVKNAVTERCERRAGNPVEEPC
jgi:hypothetical protein